MLPESLKQYRERAVEIMVSEHLRGPLMEKAHNANSRTGLIKALKEARLSFQPGKRRNELDTIIQMVEADLSR